MLTALLMKLRCIYFWTQLNPKLDFWFSSPFTQKWGGLLRNRSADHIISLDVSVQPLVCDQILSSFNSYKNKKYKTAEKASACICSRQPGLFIFVVMSKQFFEKPGADLKLCFCLLLVLEAAWWFSCTSEENSLEFTMLMAAQFWMWNSFCGQKRL